MPHLGLRHIESSSNLTSVSQHVATTYANWSVQSKRNLDFTGGDLTRTYDQSELHAASAWSSPCLTNDDGFVLIQGNRFEGGWGFNYSMAMARQVAR